MAVYDVSGEQTTDIYSVEESSVNSAFDYNGDVAFLNTFKVCTYNVGGWYIGSGTNVPSNEKSAFLALQTGMIESIDPDVLIIQEYLANFSADGTSAQTMLEGLFPYVHTKTSGTYYGRAICSKYPITDYTERYYTNNASRYYDSCTITINGAPITFVDTHLEASDSAKRIAQATEMYNFVKTLTAPFIICGDFNSTLYDPFSEVNAAIYNQYLNDDCTIANDGAFGIFNTACNSADWGNDAFAIDNIICSSAFEIETVNTDTTKTTNADVLATGKIDHIPLYAMMSIGGT